MSRRSKAVALATTTSRRLTSQSEIPFSQFIHLNGIINCIIPKQRQMKSLSLSLHARANKKLRQQGSFISFCNIDNVIRNQIDGSIFSLAIAYILTNVSRVRHIGGLGPVEKRHEEVIFALGIGTRPGSAFYDPGAFCRIRTGCCYEQQQNAVVHNPGVIHRLQTEKIT